LYYARNLPEVKSIVESFEGSGVLVTQAKNSLQTPSLATQLLKIKDQYECLVNLIDIMESAKCTIKEAVQAIQGIDLEKILVTLAVTLKKNRKQRHFKNNECGKIRHFTNCLQFAPALSAHKRFSGEKFYYAAKILAKDRSN